MYLPVCCKEGGGPSLPPSFNPVPTSLSSKVPVENVVLAVWGEACKGEGIPGVTLWSHTSSGERGCVVDPCWQMVRSLQLCH